VDAAPTSGSYDWQIMLASYDFLSGSWEIVPNAAKTAYGIASA
jgi:hypothetical protein